ncbi:hypothetical protein, partial [Aeromonas jandaei]|uniref:hypothetical protein n=1 Tax=Aeromonas TaxID=642 RepID=UPI003BA0A80C
LAPDDTSHYALPFLLGNKLPTQAVRQSSLFSCQATLGERLPPKLNAVSLSMKLTALGGGVHHITTYGRKK